jgi:hypothetical protein
LSIHLDGVDRDELAVQKEVIYLALVISLELVERLLRSDHF